MRIRNVPPQLIARAMVEAHKAGPSLSRDELEAHYLAGGNVGRWCTFWCLPIRPISTSPTAAAAIDPAGRDVFDAVQMFG